MSTSVAAAVCRYSISLDCYIHFNSAITCTFFHRRLQHGMKLEDLPEIFKRLRATTAQLIGEYYWVIYTRKIEIPGPEVLRQWTGWS
jgi:hypothetical protein